MNTLHPHVKTLLAGLFIAVVSQGIAPLITATFYYIPTLVVPFPLQVSGIIAVATAFFIEEAIRKSNRPRRAKIMLACGVLAVAALAYFAFWALVFRWFGV